MLADTLDFIVFFGLVIFIAATAWVAHWGQFHLFVRYLINILIGFLGFLMMAFGLLILVFVTDQAGPMAPHNVNQLGQMILLMGASAIPSLIPPVRRFLSKTTFPGLDPTLPVHTWALFIYLAALKATIYNVTVLYDPEAIIQSLQGMSLKVMASTNAVMFVIFAFLAAGVWAKKSFRQTVVELGLTRLAWKTAGLMVAFALVLAIGIQILEWLLLPLVDPEMRETIERVVQALQTTGTVRQTLISATIVGLAAGVGEEILFRGLIQPVFGVIPTAILFTLIHVHYGPTVLLLELFVLGVILGLVRQKYNTTAAIIVHAFFDFFVILSSLFAL